jgi:Holliday junction resolvase RusA-like endonuclease
MGPIVIELAGEPRGKGRPRFVRATGHAFTPAATRSYESALRLAGQQVMNGANPLDGPLAVEVLAWMTVPASWSKRKRDAALNGAVKPTGRPDVDNLLKVLDSLNTVVWRDDRQIVWCSVAKMYASRPCLQIKVEAAP